MTLNNAILTADFICPNTVETEFKVKVISTLEGRMIKEILSRYVDVTYDVSFKGYEYERDSEKELIVESPYDEMYAHYLAAQIHLKLHEQPQYNNEMTIFQSILEDYKVYMSQKHRRRGISRYRVR